MLFRFLSILTIFLFFTSCSKDKPVYQPTEKIDPYILYEDAYTEFEKNNFFYANKKFLEAESGFENLDDRSKSCNNVMFFSLWY